MKDYKQLLKEIEYINKDSNLSYEEKQKQLEIIQKQLDLLEEMEKINKDSSLSYEEKSKKLNVLESIANELINESNKAMTNGRKK